MKRTNIFAAILFATLITLIASCSKDDPKPSTPTDTFPAPISSNVSQSMVDSLRNAGATINSGTTPPIVNGIYLMHPDSCIYDNSPGNFANTLFTDYKFRFTNQDNSLFTLLVEQKAIPAGTLSSTPVSTYISGSGNNFSIFILRTITPGGIAVQQYNVLSGTLTAAGIQNLQNTLYVRSKGSDPSGTYPPTGTIRVFVTGATGLAAISGSF